MRKSEKEKVGRGESEKIEVGKVRSGEGEKVKKWKLGR
jgi:hypothetical protein